MAIQIADKGFLLLIVLPTGVVKKREPWDVAKLSDSAMEVVESIALLFHTSPEQEVHQLPTANGPPLWVAWCVAPGGAGYLFFRTANDDNPANLIGIMMFAPPGPSKDEQAILSQMQGTMMEYFGRGKYKVGFDLLLTKERPMAALIITPLPDTDMNSFQQMLDYAPIVAAAMFLEHGVFSYP